MKKLVVFTGAGISAESGIKTFRDSDGLWEEYNIMDVATPQAWAKNPELVLNFYNERKAQVEHSEPNQAHKLLAELESRFDVQVITQNIDDLHERAGSSHVLHLHGLITQSKSSIDDRLIYNIGYDKINIGDLCEKGTQLRPNIVWFGEDVPNMSRAEKITREADIFIVIGTSLNVYPAANLIHAPPKNVHKFLIDPKETKGSHIENLTCIQEKATSGLLKLVTEYL